MAAINAPCCERCWIDRNSLDTPDGLTIRIPTRLVDPEPETCHYCGQVTIFGIYVREVV